MAQIWRAQVSGGAAIWAAQNGAGASGPSISGVSDTTPTNGQSITITGTGFGASQGSGSVTIGGITQTVTAWADTSITINVVRGTNRYGLALDLIVTQGTASPAASVTLQPDVGWGFVIRTSVGNVGELQTTPAAAIGDGIHWDTKGGSITVGADGVPVYDPGITPGVTSFNWEPWTPGDGWGSMGTETLVTALNLVAENAVSLVAASAPALVQAHQATLAAGTVATAAQSVAVTQVHQLAPDAGSSATTGSAPSMGGAINLGAAPGNVQPLAAAVALTQRHALASAAGTSATAAASPAVTQAHALAAAPGSSATTGSAPGFDGSITLGAAPGSSAGAAATVAIVQRHAIAAAAGASAVAGSAVFITIDGVTLELEDPRAINPRIGSAIAGPLPQRIGGQVAGVARQRLGLLSHS